MKYRLLFLVVLVSCFLSLNGAAGMGQAEKADSTENSRREQRREREREKQAEARAARERRQPAQQRNGRKAKRDAKSDANRESDSAGDSTEAPQTAPSTPPDLEDQLKAAAEQRDNELRQAAGEKDRAKLQKRQSEILAKHTAIVAALRERYLENVDAAKANVDNRPSVRTPKPGGSSSPGQTTKQNVRLNDAQRRLEEEVARYEAKIAQLRQELQDTETSKPVGATRRLQKAIERETISHQAKKAVLEKRVRESRGDANPN